MGESCGCHLARSASRCGCRCHRPRRTREVAHVVSSVPRWLPAAASLKRCARHGTPARPVDQLKGCSIKTGAADKFSGVLARGEPVAIQPVANLKEFFKDALHDALSHQHVAVEGETEHYVVNLLTMFSDADALYDRSAGQPPGARLKP